MKKMSNRKDGTKSSDGTLKMLNLMIDRPDECTTAFLSEQLKVGKDAVKRKARIIKENGFDVKQSGYPDYTYSVENVIKKNEKTN